MKCGTCLKRAEQDTTVKNRNQKGNRRATDRFGLVLVLEWGRIFASQMVQDLKVSTGSPGPVSRPPGLADSAGEPHLT